jgi:hypothetical protein
MRWQSILVYLIFREEVGMFINSFGRRMLVVESKYFKGKRAAAALDKKVSIAPIKRQKMSLFSAAPPPPPPLKQHVIVSAIDPAPENMAIAQWRGGGEFREAGRSMHITQDGRMFEYKESNITLLTLQWVMAHQDLWRESEFIYIEWQFAKEKGRERACLLIKMALESIFMTLYMEGKGPKPICEVASWWKTRVGVEVGGSDHDGNKLRAIEVFRNHPETGGEAAIQMLKQKFGKKIDDPIEARLMCIALKNEIHNLRKYKDKFYSSHKQHGSKKRFSEDERWFPLLTHAEPDPLVHREPYANFKKAKAVERKEKKQKRLSDSLSKHDNDG